MSTEKAEKNENYHDFNMVRIEGDLYARVQAVIPAVAKATGTHRLNATAAIHHLINKGLREYEG